VDLGYERAYCGSRIRSPPSRCSFGIIDPKCKSLQDVNQLFFDVRNSEVTLSSTDLKTMACHLTNCFLERHPKLKSIPCNDPSCVFEWPEELFSIYTGYSIAILDIYYFSRMVQITEALRNRSGQLTDQIQNYTSLLSAILPQRSSSSADDDPKTFLFRNILDAFHNQQAGKMTDLIKKFEKLLLLGVILLIFEGLIYFISPTIFKTMRLLVVGLFISEFPLLNPTGGILSFNALRELFTPFSAFLNHHGFNLSAVSEFSIQFSGLDSRSWSLPVLSSSVVYLLWKKCCSSSKLNETECGRYKPAFETQISVEDFEREGKEYTRLELAKLKKATCCL